MSKEYDEAKETLKILNMNPVNKLIFLLEKNILEMMQEHELADPVDMNDLRYLKKILNETILRTIGKSVYSLEASREMDLRLINDEHHVKFNSHLKQEISSMISNELLNQNLFEFREENLEFENRHVITGKLFVLV